MGIKARFYESKALFGLTFIGMVKKGFFLEIFFFSEFHSKTDLSVSENHKAVIMFLQSHFTTLPVVVHLNVNVDNVITLLF